MGQTERRRSAQCKSECVNMYRPNLVIPHSPGPVIGCLIEADEGRDRAEMEGGDMRYELPLSSLCA